MRSGNILWYEVSPHCPGCFGPMAFWSSGLRLFEEREPEVGTTMPVCGLWKSIILTDPQVLLLILVLSENQCFKDVLRSWTEIKWKLRVGCKSSQKPRPVIRQSNGEVHFQLGAHVFRSHQVRRCTSRGRSHLTDTPKDASHPVWVTSDRIIMLKCLMRIYEQM